MSHPRCDFSDRAQIAGLVVSCHCATQTRRHSCLTEMLPNLFRLFISLEIWTAWPETCSGVVYVEGAAALPGQMAGNGSCTSRNLVTPHNTAKLREVTKVLLRRLVLIEWPRSVPTGVCHPTGAG